MDSTRIETKLKAGIKLSDLNPCFKDEITKIIIKTDNIKTKSLTAPFKLEKRLPVIKSIIPEGEKKEIRLLASFISFFLLLH